MATRTFEEASKHIQANLQKHLDKLQRQDSAPNNGSDSENESASSGDDLDAADSSLELVERLFAGYGVSDASLRSRVAQAVSDSLRRGAATSTCLICIGSMKANSAVWSCEGCFCSFHMQCIQRWAKDSLAQQKMDADNEPEHVKIQRTLMWCCPKCRLAYTPSQVPAKYRCYCGQLEDPPFDQWLVPHSCGEVCGKPLACNTHKCSVLCHPGPCPPCPQMVTVKCFCGQSAPATRRCFDRAWSCAKPCARALECGQHKCPNRCHEGQCPPCSKTSVQLCLCNRHTEHRKCSEAKWKCTEKCGRPLGCGHHVCDVVCCPKGRCPPCPLSEVRRCPCGKTTHVLPCTLATPTCGDTCGKLLTCGQHYCHALCHRGQCLDCSQMVDKKCRCGAKRKEVPCMKEFLCDIKCKQLRDCKRHSCSRRCCDGNCPPCEQICNKPLACKNHKCAARCHAGGACYPCTETRSVSCACGKTALLVPCGRERDTQPPKCKKKCQKPTECHHEQRQPHNCHFGPCPPCKLTCGVTLSCGHECAARCHDSVKMMVSDGSNGGKKKAAGPWEESAPRLETKATPCPDCQVPVAVTCLGGHDTSDWPCFCAKPASCGRICGRQLACGNHVCERSCHRVKNAASAVSAGATCRRCERPCELPRKEGCTHACTKPCHPAPCTDCTQSIRTQCHCGLVLLYVKCEEWTTLMAKPNAEEDKEKLLCCQNRCPKNMTCGHLCLKLCHLGECSNASSCKKKVKVYCACKRRKEEKPCGETDNATRVLACDGECDKNKKSTSPSEEAAPEEHWLREKEERLKREELDRYEKQFEAKRKRKTRRRQSELQEQAGLSSKTVGVILAVVVAAVAAIVLVYAK